MRTTKLISCFAVVFALAMGAAAQTPAPAAPARPAATKAAPAKPAAQGQRALSYKNLKYPSINNIKVPEPVRFELPNGIVVYLVEDHELPTVTVRATIRGGSRLEPAGKTGLASIAGTVMRSGGSTTRNGDQLDEELDRLGASVETGIGQDSGYGSVSVLKEDLDKGLDILADILQHPAFPQEKIDLAKIRLRDGVARRNDNPNSIAFREFGRIVYGKDSPYGRITEYATIDAITRDDLIAFHKRFFQPENVMLGAWGDFDTAAMRAKIEKVFGSWARGNQPKPEIPEVDPAARDRSGVYSISKDDMQQSWVIMGMLAGKRNDPDYTTLEVMNEVHGGGFSSRLFSKVRTDQGLAYAVYSNWGAGWDVPGTFTAAGSSKPETTVKIYQSIRNEIARMADGGATEDELQRAKDGILKGFAFEFDHTGKIVNRLMTYEFYGYPKDYLQQYKAKIEKVTKDDIARVAKQYLTPDKFAVLFVGNGKYEQPLTSLGEVKAIDVTIPAPKQKEVGPATAETSQKGKTLLAAARQAMGGSALMGVKDAGITGKVKVDTPQGQMEIDMQSTVNIAGKMLSTMQTPMGEMKMGYDGQTAWVNAGGQIQELPAAAKAEFEGSLQRQVFFLLQRLDDPALTVQALGPADFDGKKLEAVAVADTARKLQTRIFIDPATNTIAGQQFVSSQMGGAPAETDEIYADYRDINGLKIAFKTTTKQGGKVRSEITASEVKINPGVPESAYKKP